MKRLLCFIFLLLFSQLDACRYSQTIGRVELLLRWHVNILRGTYPPVFSVSKFLRRSDSILRDYDIIDRHACGQCRTTLYMYCYSKAEYLRDFIDN